MNNLTNEITGGVRKNKLLVNYSERVKNISRQSFLRKIANVGNKTELFTCTLNDLAGSVIRQQVTGNEFNRGEGIINKARAEEIIKNFYPDGFGMVTLVDNGDGTYTISDGHHRLFAITEMASRGLLENFGHVLVSVEVTGKKDGLKNYATKGSAVGHSLINKLTDPRLGLGNMLVHFIKKIPFGSYRDVSIINKKMYPQLSAIMYTIATTKDAEELNLSEALKAKTLITKIANFLPEELDFKVTSADEKKLVNAVSFTIEILTEFIKLNDKNKGTSQEVSLDAMASNILGNATVFALFVWDRYSGREYLTGIEAKTIATRMTDKIEDVDITASLLSGKKVAKATKKFYELVRTKKKDVFGFKD